MSLAGLDGTLLSAAIAALVTAALLPLVASLGARLPAPLRVAGPRVFGLVGSLAIVALGALALGDAPRTVLEWYPGFPAEPFTLMADRLAAPFLLVLGLVSLGAFATLDTRDTSAGARARVALQAGFTLAMLAVLVARHTLLFLLAWEGMTLLSGLLVAHETTSARARQATFTYLGLSHAGTACVALALLTLSTRGGGFGFEAIATAFAQQPPAEAARLMTLLTLGFAVKLGVVPLHVWLPLAHPEAPPAASAAMSGAMVKLGLYGLLRFVWQLPGTPPHGWGTGLLLAGIATALTGALFATIESDTKRLLAWSTVKHAGVLTLATGLAALLAEAGRADLAGLALAAVFVHTIGHGLSKAAAFLAFGEAVHAAGVRNLEGLGGLARRMPGTSWAALLATLSLAGLPLFACFTGEWLIVQALILGFSAGAGTLRLLAPFAAAGLALAGALALAALVKLYGIAFLGRPRTSEAAAAHEATPLRANLLFAVALLPLLVGVGGPWLAALFARPVSVLLPGFDASTLARTGGLLLVPAGLAPSSVSPFVVAVLGAMFVGLAVLGLRGRGRVRTVRRAPSWACGARLEPQMQYSALGYTKPLRLVFEPVLLSGGELEVLEEGSPYFARRLRHRSAVPQWVEQWLYRPFVTAVLRTSEQARRVQAGSLHVYLGYLLATLVALLLWGR
jgi:hydrogenase-4 component B